MAMERTKAFRERNSKRFYDVDFREFHADPMRVVEKIYSNFQLELRPEGGDSHAVLAAKSAHCAKDRAPLCAGDIWTDGRGYPKRVVGLHQDLWSLSQTIGVMSRSCYESRGFRSSRQTSGDRVPS